MGAENWKVTIFPVDKGEWDKIEKSGLQLTVKEDTDGKYITLKRPTKKLIKDNLVVFSPPQIGGQVKVSYEDEEGNIVRQYTKGEFAGKVVVNGTQEDLGNGTLAYVNFCVYDTQKGKGHRLESINVLEHVEYIKDATSSETKSEPAEKSEEKTVEKTTKSGITTAADALKKDLNDELPF